MFTILFKIMTNYNKMSNLKVCLLMKILILYANLMVDVRNKLVFLVFVLKISKVKLYMSSGRTNTTTNNTSEYNSLIKLL